MQKQPKRKKRRISPDDYRIIVKGAPRKDIDVDLLTQVIVSLSQQLEFRERLYREGAVEPEHREESA